MIFGEALAIALCIVASIVSILLIVMMKDRMRANRMIGVLRDISRRKSANILILYIIITDFEINFFAKCSCCNTRHKIIKKINFYCAKNSQEIGKIYNYNICGTCHQLFKLSIIDLPVEHRYHNNIDHDIITKPFSEDEIKNLRSGLFAYIIEDVHVCSEEYMFKLKNFVGDKT